MSECIEDLPVAVIGGGHWAANALLDLARLAETDPSLQLTWAVRSTNLARVFGGGADDQLPARGKLGSDLKQLVADERLQLVKRFHAEEMTNDGDALVMTGNLLSGRLILGPVDRIIVATGQRPDLDMTRELRLDFDPWLESSGLPALPLPNQFQGRRRTFLGGESFRHTSPIGQYIGCLPSLPSTRTL
jgi:hypothetical protein